MFTIQNVSRINDEIVRVCVSVDALAWAAHKRTDALGHLYGIEISNRVYQEYGVRATNPTVDHNTRAVKGLKTVILYYADTQWQEMPNNVIQLDRYRQRAG